MCSFLPYPPLMLICMSVFLLISRMMFLPHQDMETTIQKLTDSSVKSIDEMVKSKNKELTTV